jgi:hypothetical protein
MGLIREIMASIGGVLGRKVGDLLGQRIEASRSGTEGSSEEDEGEQGEGDSEQSGPSAFVDRLRGGLQSIKASLGRRLRSAKAKVEAMQSVGEEDSEEESEPEGKEDGSEENEEDGGEAEGEEGEGGTSEEDDGGEPEGSDGPAEKVKQSFGEMSDEDLQSFANQLMDELDRRDTGQQ